MVVERLRETRETRVRVKLSLNFEEFPIKINTGIGFFNHMLELFAYHSGTSLEVEAKGDLEVDFHHTVEDVGIVLGEAINEALGKRVGIARYGEATIPMEESLSQAVIDLATRPYLYFEAKFPTQKVGDFDLELVEEFFRALVFNARFTLHLRNLYGKNSHHIAESLFKAFAYAFKRALAPVEERIVSTKGTL